MTTNISRFTRCPLFWINAFKVPYACYSLVYAISMKEASLIEILCLTLTIDCFMVSKRITVEYFESLDSSTNLYFGTFLTPLNLAIYAN